MPNHITNRLKIVGTDKEIRKVLRFIKGGKYVKEIMITDPDTGGEVDIAVYKHEGGGMFAIDSSFIDQVLDDD